ncbi:MAG: hypothetical protein IH991_23530, partial [Planctomycetes bacterium]|nr:hypothetical protein [Planctomycetota bacterium]
HLESGGIYNPQTETMVGNETDSGEGPVFDRPPEQSIVEILFYASRRDRFDDAEQHRVVGEWELLTRIPLDESNAFRNAFLPAGVPFVLVGVDKRGKVVEWTTEAKDSRGNRARVYAIAGDHYSALKANSYSFCLGCHPGHSQVGGDYKERQ